MKLLRKTLNWYARLAPSYGKTKPPYDHVIQIGDPRLRKVSEDVSLDKIATDEVQQIIKKLRYVLNKYGSLGMSAPQIGMNIKLFVVQHTDKQISVIPEHIRKSKGIISVPFTVFINPTLKVTDYIKVPQMEGCVSVQGFNAEVHRYKAVEITAYDEKGDKKITAFKDWPARIVQHEMDHLSGKLFTDTMERKTLTCTCWEEVNDSKGRISIPFYPD